jgi:hypothetical protein
MATHEFECYVCGKHYGGIISNQPPPVTLRACDECCQEYQDAELKAMLDECSNKCYKSENELCVSLACPCLKCKYCEGGATNNCKVTCHTGR